jgi:hypothetical protein
LTLTSTLSPLSLSPNWLLEVASLTGRVFFFGDSSRSV